MKAVVLAMLMVGCAGPRGKAAVDPTPSWATKSGRVEAKIELAEALVLNGTPEAALQMISQMVEAGVSHPDLFVLQGRALTDMGLIEEAEIALSMATRRAPSHSEAQNRLGILYMDQQRTDEAIKRFRIAARSASKNADVHNNYGFALMAAGRHEEAVDVLRAEVRGAQERTSTREARRAGAEGPASSQTSWRLRLATSGRVLGAGDDARRVAAAEAQAGSS